MKRKLKVYKIAYASGMFRCNNRQTSNIYSTKKLKDGDFIVVEHIDCGVFIGQVLEDVSKTNYEDYTDDEIKTVIEYRYVQDIDLSNFIAEKEKEKRKEELKQKMKERFKVIDEKKKYQYYAQLDDEMKAMYEEYKQL